LRPRTTLAVGMIISGAALIVLAIGSLAAHYSFNLNWTITGGTDALLLIVGVLIFITEMIEDWLTHGQTALVDGLQSG
jgi:zinc transporter ZupT